MKYINSVLIISVTVLLAYTTISRAKINPSFNCDKASQPVEYAICSNENLANLDKKMALAYKAKRKSLSKPDRKNLKKEQKRWIKSRVLICNVSKSNHENIKTISCLINSYAKRISELQNKEFTFYKESLGKKIFTIKDRLKWKKLVNWPKSCFFDRLEYMSNAGLEFYKITDNSYILEVMCDRRAYQAEYKIYAIYGLPNTINAVKLNIPQIKFKNGEWHSYQSNKIIGHFQFYKKDKTLLHIQKYSGAGQCGHSATYRINTNKQSILKVILNTAQGNNDCNKDMSEDDWQNIKPSNIQ